MIVTFNNYINITASAQIYLQCCSLLSLCVWKRKVKRTLVEEASLDYLVWYWLCTKNAWVHQTACKSFQSFINPMCQKSLPVLQEASTAQELLQHQTPPWIASLTFASKLHTVLSPSFEHCFGFSYLDSGYSPTSFLCHSDPPRGLGPRLPFLQWQIWPQSL